MQPYLIAGYQVMIVLLLLCVVAMVGWAIFFFRERRHFKKACHVLLEGSTLVGVKQKTLRLWCYIIFSFVIALWLVGYANNLWDGMQIVREGHGHAGPAFHVRMIAGRVFVVFLSFLMTVCVSIYFLLFKYDKV